MPFSPAVLILSCDKYVDLWKTFFSFFWKNWPNCSYPVYLGSNTVSYKDDKRVKTILSGKDSDWSTSYKAILSKIPEKLLFIWVEDGFIINKVNNEEIQNTFKFMYQNNARHVHFRPFPKPNIIHKNDKYGIYPKGIPYRVNVVGFWKKEYLKKLLLNGENSWNFEIMGSYRTSYGDGFYCLLKPAINYIHLVEKGNWIREGLIYCKKNNIDIDFNKRAVAKLNIINIIKDRYYKIILNKPWASRVKLMNLLRKLLISY